MTIHAIVAVVLQIEEFFLTTALAGRFGCGRGVPLPPLQGDLQSRPYIPSFELEHLTKRERLPKPGFLGVRLRGHDRVVVIPAFAGIQAYGRFVRNS